MTKTWYERWFDTTYYHILYNNRDDSEAKSFIKNIERNYSKSWHIMRLNMKKQQAHRAVGLLPIALRCAN